jgi:hypothetical protein
VVHFDEQPGRWGRKEYLLSSKLYDLLFGMITLCGSLAGQTVAVPIHEYLLNENPITAGGTAHDSAQSLNGTYTGNVMSAAGFRGAPNHAAHFDGISSSVQLSGVSPTNVNIGTLGLYTVTTWIKVDPGFAQADRFIYDESDAGDGCCGYRPTVLLRLTNVNGVGGILEFGIHQDIGWNFADVTNAPPLDPTRWYLVAGVLSAAAGQSAFLFDDTGTLIGSANIPNYAPTDSFTNFATIGAWTGSSCETGCPTTVNSPFLGSLQDVNFYNTDLTATQLSSFPLPNPLFFLNEAPLADGVYYLQFQNKNLFGYYSYVSNTILYHYEMGYEAFVPGPSSDIYLYDFTSTHWLYTSTTLFPYLYDFNLNAWIYYLPNTKNPGHYTTNPRYFSNLTTNIIFTM